MEVVSVELTDFRNYEQQTIGFQPGLNLVVGLNGQGKTNLLEAIHALSVMGSHRAGQSAALVRHGQERALVRADGFSRSRPVHLDLEVKRSGGMRMLINKVPLERARDAGTALATILFSPEDLALTKGGPEERRRFLDQIAVRLRPLAGQERHEFERVLRQRNGVLKAAHSSATALSTLDTWDEQLVRTGAAVVQARLDVLARLRPTAEKRHAEVAGNERPPGFAYLASWAQEIPDYDGIPSLLEAAIKASRSKDVERGVTTSGPHRDDLEIMLAAVEARTFASQGEQRSLALSLRLAERDLVAEARGEDPILLLDDVFSELDDTRREKLAELVFSSGQTVATATATAGIPLDAGGVITVDGGRVIGDA